MLVELTTVTASGSAEGAGGSTSNVTASNTKGFALAEDSEEVNVVVVEVIAEVTGSALAPGKDDMPYTYAFDSNPNTALAPR